MRLKYLAHLPEEQAYLRFCHERLKRDFRGVLWAALILLALKGLAFIAIDRNAFGLLELGALISVGGIFYMERRNLLEAHLPWVAAASILIAFPFLASSGNTVTIIVVGLICLTMLCFIPWSGFLHWLGFALIPLISLLFLQNPDQIGTTVLILITPAFAFASFFFRNRSRGFFMDEFRETCKEIDHQRMKGQLADAQRIQLSMLPSQMPDLAHFDLAAVCVPAYEVGGDYYDCIELDDDQACVVIGDVSGHGVASGLVLSAVRAALVLLNDEADQPEALLAKMNLLLKKVTDRKMFMSFLAIHLDAGRNLCRYTVAGHPFLFHFQRESGRVDLIEERGIALGVVAQAKYDTYERTIAKGDLLLLFSDGLFEATNENREEYGLRRLRSIFYALARSGQGAEVVKNGILNDVKRFMGYQIPHDDMTILVVRVQ